MHALPRAWYQVGIIRTPRLRLHKHGSMHYTEPYSSKAIIGFAPPEWNQGISALGAKELCWERRYFLQWSSQLLILGAHPDAILAVCCRLLTDEQSRCLSRRRETRASMLSSALWGSRCVPLFLSVSCMHHYLIASASCSM